MPFNISACLSMESQGYPLKSNVVYQYNQGKIHMESNVRSSCTGNYCHIQISYFFVNYRQYRGGLVYIIARHVKCCPFVLQIHYREDFSMFSGKLSWYVNMSVNLKNCYQLHPRIVLGRWMKSKTLIFHLIRNPT